LDHKVSVVRILSGSEAASASLSQGQVRD